MGYEIIFKYHEKKKEGIGYNTESIKEYKKVIGSQFDEIELDDAAKVVFGQMARRDIMVIDLEVYEYTKKKLSFRETKDGIVIKNKKFSYDITGAIKSQDENILPAQPIIQNGQVLHPHQLMTPTAQPTPAAPVQTDYSHLPVEVQQEIQQMKQQQVIKPASPNERMRPILPPAGQPLRYEVYDPHPDLRAAAKAKRLPFTIGKRYPIFEEKPARGGVMLGMMYHTVDDNGTRCILNDKHFVPEQNLTRDFADDPRHNHHVNLSHNNGGSEHVVINGKSMELPDIFTLGNMRRR